MSDEASVSSRCMKRWGIPEQERKSNELTLLERLVWVQYKNHWWPALLYEDYSELQTALYDQLDMVLKAQFAMAIMRQMQDTKKVRVARLLGRQVLEVVEVEGDTYAEFYWQLPKVLPAACDKKRYGNDTDLYLDFHRALDQVEEIIREVSENSFNLLPGHDQRTWLERAKDAMVVTPQGKPRVTSKSDAAALQEDTNPVFQAMDAIMETFSHSFDDLTGATNFASDLSGTAISNATTVAAGNKGKGHVPDKYTNAITSKKNRLRITNKAPSRDVPSPPKQSVADSIRIVESLGPQNSPVPETPLFSHRSKAQPASSSSHPTADEARDPSPENRKLKNTNGESSSSGVSGSARRRDQRRASSEVLPGLEADDIVPGLGGVLRAMNMYSEEEVKEEEEKERGLDVTQHGVKSSSNKPVRNSKQKEMEEIHMYEEMQPSIEISPLKKSAASFSPTRPVALNSPKEPIEQRDTGVVERPLEVAVAERKEEQSLWSFLTCRAIDA